MIFDLIGESVKIELCGLKQQHGKSGSRWKLTDIEGKQRKVDSYRIVFSAEMAGASFTSAQLGRRMAHRPEPRLHGA